MNPAPTPSGYRTSQTTSSDLSDQGIGLFVAGGGLPVSGAVGEEVAVGVGAVLGDQAHGEREDLGGEVVAVEPAVLVTVGSDHPRPVCNGAAAVFEGDGASAEVARLDQADDTTGQSVHTGVDEVQGSPCPCMEVSLPRGADLLP